MTITITIQNVGKTRAEEFSKMEDARDFLIKLAGEAPVEEPVEEPAVEPVEVPEEPVLEEEPTQE